MHGDCSCFLKHCSVLVVNSMWQWKWCTVGIQIGQFYCDSESTSCTEALNTIPRHKNWSFLFLMQIWLLSSKWLVSRLEMDHTDVPVLLKECPLNGLLCVSPLLCPTQNSSAPQRRRHWCCDCRPKLFECSGTIFQFSGTELYDSEPLLQIA